MMGISYGFLGIIMSKLNVCKQERSHIFECIIAKWREEGFAQLCSRYSRSLLVFNDKDKHLNVFPLAHQPPSAHIH